MNKNSKTQNSDMIARQKATSNPTKAIRLKTTNLSISLYLMLQKVISRKCRNQNRISRMRLFF